MTRDDVIDDARRLLASRDEVHGKVDQNFQRVARLWTVHLSNQGIQVVIEPHDVAIMMALFKIARLEHSPAHGDSWLDVVGYAALGAEVAGAK